MASFAAQAAIRSKWSDLVESSSIEMPGEVTSGVKSVVGWLKQASLEVKQAGVRTFQQFSSGNMQTITILHFNDVYNIEPQKDEPVGGAARFCTVLKSFSHLNPLVLFSGDAFSPSMLSTFTKGEQMAVVLNECGVQCSVFGNHEFDFGLETLSERVSETNFPWLMSNIIDNETGRPLGDGKVIHVLDWNDKRIGLIGLVEKEWLDTLATINPDEVTFLDFVEVGNKLGAQLKREGCDYVIALTHMRFPNDNKLAENVTDIDLILGGHDHVYEVRKVNGKYIVKSGTDFRQLSKITINFKSITPEITIEEVNVTSMFEEDDNLKQQLDKYAAIMEGKLTEELGVFNVPLDGRFIIMRTQESNLGNFVCDVLLAATGADLVILNSGTFRLDRIHPAGPFILGDLVNLIPLRDLTVLISVTGEQIIAALENGVSKYPNLEGRFPQVAGCSFAFDPHKPAGERVDPQLVRIGDEYISLSQKYSLATKMYVYNGCDGYTMLKNSDVLMNEEECPEIGLALRNHFQSIKQRLGQTKRSSKHRQSLVTLSRRHSLVKSLEGSELDGPTPLRHHGLTESIPHNQHHRHPHLEQPHRLTRRASLDDLEQETCQLSPKVQGRIVLLNDEIRRELLLERERVESANVIPEEDQELSSPLENDDDLL